MKFVEYAGCVIYDAKPPITAELQSQIESKISGPIPEQLLDLWNVTFGGQLGYDLRIEIGGQHSEMSFRQLFELDKKYYDSFWHWVHHELELAEEAAQDAGEPFKGTLDFLPFGGFEYLERMYVCTNADDYGAVYAFKQGLPEAWQLQLNQNAVARVADDVEALFQKLVVHRDPRALGPNDYASGEELMGLLADLEETDAERATYLRDLFLSRLLDWTSALRDKTIKDDLLLSQLAIEASVSTGDKDLLDALSDAGVDILMPLTGGGNIVDHCMWGARFEIVEYLLDHGFSCTNAFANYGGNGSVEFVQRLLDAGAKPDRAGAANSARAGQLESAKLIAGHLSADDFEALKKHANQQIGWNNESIASLKKGTLISQLTADDYADRNDVLAEFLTWLEDRTDVPL